MTTPSNYGYPGIPIHTRPDAVEQPPTKKTRSAYPSNMTPPMGMQGGMNVNVSGGMNRGNGQGVTNVINLTGNSNGSMRNAQTYPNGVSVNGGNMMSGQALRPGQNIIAGQKNGQNFRGSYTNNTSVTVDSNRSKGTPSVNLNYFTSDCLNRERLGQIMKELCMHVCCLF
eukprot:TRINITY_DN3029_c0_g1_i3.p1 TRINITY_DN3029_c0_g1~~TRINITY_DN3029_c0_g1_i3.p1  ORF type:complete len:170 (+),score=27.95 TRINITY_DN3029_c0_g1_i3:144-653(+)